MIDFKAESAKLFDKLKDIYQAKEELISIEQAIREGFFSMSLPAQEKTKC